jgi:CBS domain-containing protein
MLIETNHASKLLMKISDAIPNIFRRTYPIIEPGTQMLLAVSLLRFHQIDALPIGFKPQEKKRLAVFGYSCLSRLLETDPKNYRKFLELPCERVALELSAIDGTESLDAMLRLFEKTRFGFTWVESERLGGFASLHDLLSLYENGMISTEMTAGEAASPIFSLPGESNLRTVLQEMFNHRFRRIFVSNGKNQKSLVTDRRILSYVFSTAKLGEVTARPEKLLDAKLGDVEKIEPVSVSEGTPVAAAAKLMSDSNEDCLVCKKGVITPWDLIMRPLASDRLKISS